MEKFPLILVNTIARYLDNIRYNEYLAQEYILDWWFESQPLINTEINLDIFPKTLINIICKYLDIDEFYKLREKYTFLDIKDYDNLGQTFMNTRSYIRYKLHQDANYGQQYPPAGYMLDWACCAGYLEIIKNQQNDKFFLSSTLSCATRSHNYNKNYSELIEYVYWIIDFNAYDDYLDYEFEIPNIINSRNSKAIKFMFNTIFKGNIENMINKYDVYNKKELNQMRNIIGDVMGFYPNFSKLNNSKIQLSNF